jgi:hypothetical protein
MQRTFLVGEVCLGRVQQALLLLRTDEVIQ